MSRETLLSSKVVAPFSPHLFGTGINVYVVYFAEKLLFFGVKKIFAVLFVSR
jgi:hypothetical protein